MAARKGKSKPKRSPLYVIPNTPETWEHFGRFFDARKALRPPGTEDTLFVADARGLVAGVCLYPTRGPFFFLEHLSTNPGCPAKLRHRAVVLLATLVRAYAAAHSKYPIAVVRHRSISRILQRHGFTHSPGAVLTAAPILEVP